VTTTHGGAAATNEGVRNLVDTAPDRFIGFASVDPHRPDALEVLEYAFRDLELKGLKLHPPRQAFHPDGPELRPLYELCVKYDRPIIFHSGVSMEPGTSAKYAHPMNFESVAREIPELRFCLAHFGWPWVRETCMLLLKYPNVYADTALWYFDTPEEFYEQVFTKDMGSHWIDRSFRHQVMFGSDAPRFGALRLIEALRDFDMRESSRELILGGNAARFLGG
jgi:predicted TIM-barrel fold metal-dependent hydrolase